MNFSAFKFLILITNFFSWFLSLNLSFLLKNFLAWKTFFFLFRIFWFEAKVKEKLVRIIKWRIISKLLCMFYDLWRDGKLVFFFDWDEKSLFGINGQICIYLNLKNCKLAHSFSEVNLVFFRKFFGDFYDYLSISPPPPTF